MEAFLKWPNLPYSWRVVGRSGSQTGKTIHPRTPALRFARSCGGLRERGPERCSGKIRKRFPIAECEDGFATCTARGLLSRLIIMASMSPNPFTIPLQKSAPAPAGSPTAVKSAPPGPPEAGRAARAAAATIASGGSFGTWTDKQPKVSPDFTASVRDALGKLRRAQLSRVVKSVVLASAIVCVAALARAAIRADSGPELEVTHASRISMKGREFSSTFLTVHDDWDPVVTRAAAKHAARRGGGRGAITRAHGK
jgi:hypothetical protein